MKTYDIAVIGSGIGGSLFAALNRTQHDLILFEKDHNVGGCASTFERYGGYYNSGATTFVGYEQGHLIGQMFKRIGFTPKLRRSEVGVRVIQEEKTVDRVKDFDTFLAMVDREYPNPFNRMFWETIREIDQKFWELKHIYYAKHSIGGYIKTLHAMAELLSVYRWDLLMSAERFIRQTLGEIDAAYQNFIDAQLLITLQTTSKELSLLAMALGLSYTFHDTFYAEGGMGCLIEGLLEGVPVKRQEAILSIEPLPNGHYELMSTKGTYYAKKVVLNSTVYNSGNLFKNPKIQAYYNRFSFSDQSAFVVYLRLQSEEKFLHHYQLIQQEDLPFSISNAIFVSFSDSEDQRLSEGGYSVTISTHTRATIWQNLSKEAYKAQKKELQEHIIEAFLHYFDTIKAKDISRAFSATSKTFHRYIGRYNCGGEAFKLKNLLSIPSCRTPFEGLYHVGDTVFAGQGWPGVALGVDILDKEING